MMQSFLRYLPVMSVKVRSEESPIAIPSSAIQVPDGYHAPVSACEQLAKPRRQQWLQMLWDCSSLPKEMYQQYYLQPLERCVILMQQLPATEGGHHAYLGGMVDHLLETVAYAARLSKNYLLPVGAQPEEQASQSAAWNAVIVYAAMLQSLDKLCQIEVELVSGQRWMPLNAMPGEPYRFRFTQATNAVQTQSFGAMLAWKVIPDEAVFWLSTWPDVLNTLLLYLTGFRNESGIVNTIVADAIAASTGKGGSDVINVTQRPASPVSLEAALPLTEHFINSESSPVLVPSPLFAENASSVSSVSSPDRVVIEEPDIQQEDVAGDLLAVMGFSEAANTVTNARETLMPETAISTEASNDTALPASAGIGERFWQWLSEGCCSGAFPVNTENARIHIIAGYVFVRAPNIFHQFLSENCEISEDKIAVQNAFEKLGRHRQDKGVMYTCHLYQDLMKQGQFKRLAGYLIIAKKLYRSHNIPEENPSLIVKHQDK